jgi:hypothetical protein
MNYCDYNNDDTICAAEIFDCVMRCENEYRHEYCWEAEDLYCQNNWPCIKCEGAWTCDDVSSITLEVMAYFDTNNDGQINLGDDIEGEHLAEM